MTARKCKLSDNKGTIWNDDDSVELYDISNLLAKHITQLTAEELQELTRLCCDGCCPVCFEEIPLNDVICDDCLQHAKVARQ